MINIVPLADRVVRPLMALKYGPITDTFDPTHVGRLGWFLVEAKLEDFDDAAPYVLDPIGEEVLAGSAREYLDSHAWAALARYVESEAHRYTAADVHVTGWSTVEADEQGHPTLVVPQVELVRTTLRLFGVCEIEVSGLKQATAKHVLDKFHEAQPCVVQLPGLLTVGGIRTRHIALHQMLDVDEEVLRTPIGLAQLVGQLSPEADGLWTLMEEICRKATGERWVPGGEFEMWEELRTWRDTEGTSGFRLHNVAVDPEDVRLLDELQRRARGWVWHLDVIEAGPRFVHEHRWERLTKVREDVIEELGDASFNPPSEYLDARVR